MFLLTQSENVSRKGVTLKGIQSFVYLEHNTDLDWFLLQPQLKSQKPCSQIKTPGTYPPRNRGVEGAG